MTDKLGIRPVIRATPLALPALLSEIARATDREIALTVARTFGGREVYIHRKARADHPLALAVGLDAAAIIGERFGGQSLKIPSAKPFMRWCEVHRLRDEGKSVAEIAAAVQLGHRYVQRLLEGHEAPPRQTTPVPPISGNGAP